MTLTQEQIDILYHTQDRSARRMYYADERDQELIKPMVTSGLMRFVGSHPLCSDMTYTLTDYGVAFLENGG